MDHITHLTLVLSNKQYSDITNACHSKPNIMFNFGLLASSLSLDIRYSFMVVIPNVKHVRYPVCSLVSVVGSSGYTWIILRSPLPSINGCSLRLNHNCLVPLFQVKLFLACGRLSVRI